MRFASFLLGYRCQLSQHKRFALRYIADQSNNFDEWLETEAYHMTEDQMRSIYKTFIKIRLENSINFINEANDARKNLISIYIAKEDYKTAVANYSYIFKKNPKKFKDFYLFSYVLMKSGDFKNAIEGFKNEININPNNANAYAHLGYSYLNLKPSNTKSALTFEYSKIS